MITMQGKRKLLWIVTAMPQDLKNFKIQVKKRIFPIFLFVTMIPERFCFVR